MHTFLLVGRCVPTLDMLITRSEDFLVELTLYDLKNKNISAGFLLEVLYCYHIVHYIHEKIDCLD